MHPMDLYNKAIVAASVAEANGNDGTRQAFLEIAKWLYFDVERSKVLIEHPTVGGPKISILS